ncbi:MAG TPA: glycosyltransferase family 4 protein [Bacteroidales bacterium]|nr:glycosyltransferase family 4 protein [Bacteroidales bacterium]
MKVAFLVTGSGGSFYCSNCYRDMLYLRAIKSVPGMEAVAVPLYLPPEKVYIESGFDTNVFFGAISLYVREKFHFLEGMPSFFDKILDAPPLLRLAAKSAGSTRTDGLEDLTLNMISSQNSIRNNEIIRLVRYLESIGKPDVIHLSNALIIGLARQIKEHLDVKIVCSLLNEDDWLNEMAEPFRSQAWKMIAEEAQYVDAFISPSRYYSEFFVAKAGPSVKNVHVVPSGIDLSERMERHRSDSAPAIGFFSRVSYHNGFDKMADAFIKLKKERGMEDLTLNVCGGYTSDDKQFINQQIGKIKKEGFRSFIRIFPGFHGRGKYEFFDSIDVMSVPVRKYDGYGLYILEANASGIPVVQPATGAFPEIIGTTKGGILYSVDDVDTLASNLYELLTDSSRAVSLGSAGRSMVESKLNNTIMAANMHSVYSSLK